MPCRPYFLAGPVRGLATIPWGSTFPSSGHWALTADHTTVEHYARTASCRGSRAHSHARPRRRAGTAPGSASLASGPREQAADPCRVGRAPCKPGREGRCRPGPGNSKKILFYFLFGFKLNSNFKKIYLNIQSSKNYEINSVGFIIF
jgi:hypothetical protein